MNIRKLLEKYPDGASKYCQTIPEAFGHDHTPFPRDPSELENYIPEANPFYGGEIQREAHANGAYEHLTSQVRSGIIEKTWVGADDRRQDQAKRINQQQKAWRERIGEDEFSRIQSAKAAKTATKILYKGKVYRGWNALREQTGVSKYMFRKYNMGSIL